MLEGVGSQGTPCGGGTGCDGTGSGGTGCGGTGCGYGGTQVGA